MASVHSATCECGYRTTVSVGGTRANFETVNNFPFYCDTCGLVTINTRDKIIKCPACRSPKITQYGIPPASRAFDDRFTLPAIQAFSYEAYKQGNLCPKCKNYNLEFSGSNTIFD
jgi:hypothetical protein